MKTNIIIAGVGGQGILTIAAVIATAAINNNLHIKQSEVHGMSQRGGDVQSHLRISDTPIASDLIPLGQANLIISLEPMESLRYTHYLRPDGWNVTTDEPFINIPNYPDQTTLRNELNKNPNTTILSLSTIPQTINTNRHANIILLGAASPHIDIPRQALETSIRNLFARKGEDIVAANLAAFAAGYRSVATP
ncbi:MAG: indolepyruvate oxidoreductase subunit beta [Tannerellaceae bacterium]|jgi:indolepyruvate ferredoxin oxidoreductase beta subunit|nr:indolepyruvate oxidoreductase subunit beta [Tannerellaceae bacterium]